MDTAVVLGQALGSNGEGSHPRRPPFPQPSWLPTYRATPGARVESRGVRSPQVIDLHVHSTCSDGSETPERVVELAVAAGCTAVALTDHDGLGGLASRPGAGRRVSGSCFVPGCEVSCAFSPGAMHVLSYFVEPGEGPLQDELGTPPRRPGAAQRTPRAAPGRARPAGQLRRGPRRSPELCHRHAPLRRRARRQRRRHAASTTPSKRSSPRERPGYVPKARIDAAELHSRRDAAPER